MNNHCPPLLRELLQLPSPTGSEQTVQRFIHEQFHGVVDLIEPDVAGNLTLAINPNAEKKIMLAAHCDQIGFLVKRISADGYIHIDPLGGVDRGVMPGTHVVIHNQRGAVTGIIGRKPISFQGQSQASEIPAMYKMWVDIGARDREEAMEAVQVGDYVTFHLQITELRNSLITAPGLDNKAGLYVCLEVLRQCARHTGQYGVFVVSSVQEEIGSRGASTAANRIKPDIGIAVDVVPATDDPGFDMPSQTQNECSLGAGPTLSLGPNTSPAVGQLLTNAAKSRSLNVQLSPTSQAAPNDSKVIQTSDGGVAAASVGIPLRNMHTQVEIVSLRDLESTIALMCEFLGSLRNDIDLRPFAFGKE